MGIHQPSLSADAAPFQGSVRVAQTAAWHQRHPATLAAAIAILHGDTAFATSFLGRLPRRTLCSQNLRCATRATWSSELALNLAASCPWISTDATMARNALLFDLDHDEGPELVADLPPEIRPHLVVDPWSGRAHAILMLRTPVLTGPGSSPKARAFADFAQRLMACALRATALPQRALVKNPLGLLSDLAGPQVRRSPRPTSGALWDAWQASGSPLAWHTVPGVEAAELRDVVDALADEHFADAPDIQRRRRIVRSRGEPSALGRNCSLFDQVRWWAYDRAEHDGGVILAEALRINAAFAHPLPRAEVEATARSISRFMHGRWSKRADASSPRGRESGAGADLTVVERQRIAGRATAESRASATNAKITAAAEVLRCRGAPVSTAAIAAAAGVSVRTVQRHRQGAAASAEGATYGVPHQVLAPPGKPPEQEGKSSPPMERPPAVRPGRRTGSYPRRASGCAATCGRRHREQRGRLAASTGSAIGTITADARGPPACWTSRVASKRGADIHRAGVPSFGKMARRHGSLSAAPGRDDRSRSAGRRRPATMTTNTTSADDTPLDEGEAAGLVKIARETMARLRRTGNGPPHFVVGRRSIRYRRGDVLRWRDTLPGRQVEGV